MVIEATLVEWILKEVAGPAAFPTLGCIMLWFRMQKRDDQSDRERKEVLDVIKENTKVIGENTSALNRISR